MISEEKTQNPSEEKKTTKTDSSYTKRKRQRISSTTNTKRCFVAVSDDTVHSSAVQAENPKDAEENFIPSTPLGQRNIPQERPLLENSYQNASSVNTRKRPSPFGERTAVYPHQPSARKMAPTFRKQSSIAKGRNMGKRNLPSANRTPKEIVPVKYPSPMASMTEPVRLNKYLANAGVCSRREADKFIYEGLVSVNGQVITEMGARVHPQDEVFFKGEKVSLEGKIYVLLNKPKNCVTTSDDPECRRTVMDLVKNACTERIYPVGRLDRNTTGVLLITNDGDLASRLMHPSFKKKKIYHVWLNAPVAVEHMKQIAEGFELYDGEIHADAISYVKEDDLSQVGIEIHSGRNRIVRRIFEHFGYRVVKLDRVYFAGLTKKNLPRGRWRYLTEEEVSHLRRGIIDDTL